VVQDCPIDFARKIERRWQHRFSTSAYPGPAQRSARRNNSGRDAPFKPILEARGSDNAGGRHIEARVLSELNGQKE
jgi:hypothetical protein